MKIQHAERGGEHRWKYKSTRLPNSTSNPSQPDLSFVLADVLAAMGKPRVFPGGDSAIRSQEMMLQVRTDARQSALPTTEWQLSHQRHLVLSTYQYMVLCMQTKLSSQK